MWSPHRFGPCVRVLGPWTGPDVAAYLPRIGAPARFRQPTDLGGSMRRRFVTAVVGALIGLVAVSGCSDISAQLSGEQVSDPMQAEEVVTPLLETVSWGEVDGMLSVVVRNPRERTLRHATAVFVARDSAGVTVGSSTSSAKKGTCCTVYDLQPDASYGFYFDVGVDAGNVAEVEVTYRDVAWRAGASAPVPAMRGAPVALTANALGAVVLADVTTPESPVPQAVAQAFLNGPDGDFIAVVSGRWACFEAGVPRRIKMQLYHPLPAGTTVESVVAYPVGEDASHPAPDCTAP
jgi:hypothetical protein